MLSFYALDRQCPLGAIAVRQHIWGWVDSKWKWKGCENSYYRHLRPLQASETARVVGGKQVRLADVAADHVGRAVAGVGHDRPLGGPAGRRAGGQVCPQRM